jgi:hypothetical protein
MVMKMAQKWVGPSLEGRGNLDGINENKRIGEKG